jgi:hypothetical protein
MSKKANLSHQTFLPLIGFRTWEIFDGHLGSLQSDVRWPYDGILEANCSRLLKGKHLKNQAPSEDCSCGLYAFHRLKKAQELAQFYSLDNFHDLFVPWTHILCGVTIGWGKIMVCKYGFRSEYQRIIAFVPPIRPTKHLEQQLASIQKNYEFPFLSSKQIDIYAREFGTSYDLPIFSRFF